MHWQDAILTVGQIIFIIALIPSILSKNKPAQATSFLTGSVALSIAFVYVTLSLWFAAATAGINAVFWYILLTQSYRRNNGNKR